MLLYTVRYLWHDAAQRVLGPNSPSLRRRMACCVDDPSIGGSKIRGTMCQNMERTKELLVTR